MATCSCCIDNITNVWPELHRNEACWRLVFHDQTQEKSVGGQFLDDQTGPRFTAAEYQRRISVFGRPGVFYESQIVLWYVLTKSLMENIKGVFGIMSFPLFVSSIL